MIPDYSTCQMFREKRPLLCLAKLNFMLVHKVSGARAEPEGMVGRLCGPNYTSSRRFLPPDTMALRAEEVFPLASKSLYYKAAHPHMSCMTAQVNGGTNVSQLFSCGLHQGIREKAKYALVSISF